MSFVITRRALAFAATAIASLGLASAAGAADYTLRIQTHHSPESLPGKIFLQFVQDVETNSGGRIDIEDFMSSSVVKSVETFDAASTGILDGDMTGAAYQTGKDRAFQFLGDVMGGYEEPEQMWAWFKEGGGREIADELYANYNMHLVGLWGQVPESLSSTKPLAGPDDFKNWKFRSPPGMETEIFERLGASPIVMDFGEVFTALNTGIVDGADYSTLNTNRSVGLYDICKYATYPGWHSMPSDHLAINLDKRNELPEDLQKVIEDALDKAAHDLAEQSRVENEQAAKELAAAGVTLEAWSDEDIAAYRKFAQSVWQEWAEKSPLAKKAVESHVGYMKKIGLLDQGS
jgi:TRAP-type mannitol/chloroaromatic compound transport system substrate-binding protein